VGGDLWCFGWWVLGAEKISLFENISVEKQIPYGDDKQERQMQKQRQSRSPSGMTSKKGKGN
jgi:hypothetical protein